MEIHWADSCSVTSDEVYMAYDWTCKGLTIRSHGEQPPVSVPKRHKNEIIYNIPCSVWIISAKKLLKKFKINFNSHINNIAILENFERIT